MREPEFARMPGAARGGVLILCLALGGVLGAIGTLVHQSLPPIGVVLALGTVGVYLAGLRAWASVRGPAAAGTLGVALVSALLALPWGGNLLIPANAVGYLWTFGVPLVALLVLAWPNTAGFSRPRAVSMGVPLEEKDATAP